MQVFFLFYVKGGFIKIVMVCQGACPPYYCKQKRAAKAARFCLKKIFCYI